MPELSLTDLWRWTNLYERIAIYVLAFMLMYVVIVTIRVTYLCRSVQIEPNGENSQFSCRKPAIELTHRLRNLKSAASVAPYVGLLGTCAGILSIFRGYSGTRAYFVVLISIASIVSLLAPAAGIVVAIASTCSHNYLRNRVDSPKNQLVCKPSEENFRSFQAAQRLPLRPRFSGLPQFGLIATLGLIVV